MGNTANRQCPVCRAMDITQFYVGLQLVFRCDRCRHVWSLR
jgi:RNA polymerase subunit RPABC4/transcription elongation factor Spt4